MDVDAGDPAEGQHDRLGAHELAHLQLGRLFGLHDPVEVGDVQLVGDPARGTRPVRHQPSPGLDHCRQPLELVFAQDTSGRRHPNPVVGGQEVEERDVPFGLSEIRGPAAQGPGVGAAKGVEHQGRKGKLIHHLGLVGPIAEVGDVVPVRDVGLRHDQDPGRHSVEDGTKQADDPVRLGQMDAGGADLLPEIGHRVEANHLGPALDVQQQDPDHLDQHIGIAVVQVDLVGAEGRPHQLVPRGGAHRGQQRLGARPEHRREVQALRHDGEVLPERRLISQEGLKPVAAGRDVVQDQIDHQAEIPADGLHVGPSAPFGIDRVEVDHGEAVVGGVRKKRQDVNPAEDPRQVPPQESAEGDQRRFPGPAKLVAVGDHKRIAFVQPKPGGLEPSGLAHPAPGLCFRGRDSRSTGRPAGRSPRLADTPSGCFDQAGQARAHRPGRPWPVEILQVLADAPVRARRGTAGPVGVGGAHGIHHYNANRKAAQGPPDPRVTAALVQSSRPR